MSTYQEALSDFLKMEENAENALASKIGRSQAAVNRYRNGRRFPDAETARAIDEHTAGAVSFEIWQAEFMTRSGLGKSVGVAPEMERNHG